MPRTKSTTGNKRKRTYAYTFTFPVKDQTMVDFVLAKRSKHVGGIAEYLRGLVACDMAIQKDMEKLREKALKKLKNSKLSDSELKSIGIAV